MEILPQANVVKIGGQSMIDRGRAAVFPILDEVVQNLGKHQMILGTGAGTRARHAYSVGIDLKMPTGVLSVLGTFVSMQNARMLHYLLAKHGIPFIEPIQFPQLPLYLAERKSRRSSSACRPTRSGSRTRSRGSHPPAPHRHRQLPDQPSAFGGPFDDLRQGRGRAVHAADPKKDPDAKFIPAHQRPPS